MEARSTSSENRRVVRLPEDLVAEILARVSYRSLCRLKCVSRSWRSLCSSPAVCRRCPRILAGFFFRTMPLGSSQHVRHFVNASGRGTPMVDPSLPFLPPGYSDAAFLGCCNGLFLCQREHLSSHVGSRYFVCNPATGKWIDLPDTEVTANAYSCPVSCLGFDPAVSSHFRVFVLVTAPAQGPFQPWDQVTGMNVFSSETGAWSYRQSKWGDGTMAGWCSVFFNGTPYLTCPYSSSLLTVDMDGRDWRKIPTPHDFGFIGVSQGHLHAAHIENSPRGNESISIWVLEDYVEQQWILKHKVNAMQMFGARPRSFGDSYSFKVHAVHPEHSLIFLTAGNLTSLMSYDMDKKKVRFIWTLGEGNEPAHPYVPCFSDWMFDGH